MSQESHNSQHPVVNNKLSWFTSLGILLLFWIRVKWGKYQRRNEMLILQEVGNPGFSPAAAAVTQLYREGQLSGEMSVLRGKNLLGANWQRAVLIEANLEAINLQYADLREALLTEANLSKADFRRANLNAANLRGATIRRANFMQANLSRALLARAEATGASLFMAHAQRANMWGITLDYADLQEADLHGAILTSAILSNSSLRDTNFARANLEGAFLTGARMINANLTDANLSKAHFDKNTILPDAKFVEFNENRIALFDKYWTPDTDMFRYTNPNHPEYWQPEWAKRYEWVKKNYEED